MQYGMGLEDFCDIDVNVWVIGTQSENAQIGEWCYNKTSRC